MNDTIELYWFDKDGFLALAILGLDPEEGNYAQEVAALETVTIYLSDDANELLVYFFGSFTAFFSPDSLPWEL